VGGTLTKLAIGAFFVALASQGGELARDIVQRVRESVQASELATLDANLYAGWALQQRPTRAPRDQAEFESALAEVLTARGSRDVTRDRWDRPYTYEALGDRPLRWRISSSGRDRTPGTEDDLVVERRDDRATLNRDPVEIIEQAEARARGRQRAALDELRRLRERLETQGAPAPSGPSDADLEREHRACLEQLDRLLKG
jgi:hypothetical protein